MPRVVGSAWLERHGQGKVSNDQREALGASLTNELLAKGFPSSLVQQEVARFLQAGHASASNFDRLQRRLAARQAGSALSVAGSISAFSNATSATGSGGEATKTAAYSARKVHMDPIYEASGSRPATTSRPSQQVPSTPRRTPVTQAGESLLTKSGSSQPESLAIAGTSGDFSPLSESARWSNIAKLRKLLEAQERETRRQTDIQKKNQYMEVLKNQMQEVEAKRHMEQTEKVVQRQKVDEDKLRFLAEEEEKKLKFQEKLLKVKEDIGLQRVAYHARTQAEQKESLEAGKKLVAKAEHDLIEEQQALERKRIAQREEEAKQSRLWEEERQKKIEAKLVDREKIKLEKQRVEEEVAAAIRVQEEATQRALEERQKLFSELEQRKEEASLERLKKRNERLAQEAADLKAVNELHQKAEEEERLKQEKHRQERKQNVDFLVKQMKEKQKIQLAQAEVDRVFAISVEESQRQYLEAERKKVLDKETRREKYKKELVNQIETKKVKAVEGSKLKEDILSHVEVSLNRDLVEQVSQYDIH